MGAPKVEAFLTHLATGRNVAGAFDKQALAALLFLYRQVLDIDLPWLQSIGRPKSPIRIPVVLSREERLAAAGYCFGFRQAWSLGLMADTPVRGSIAVAQLNSDLLEESRPGTRRALLPR